MLATPLQPDPSWQRQLGSTVTRIRSAPSLPRPDAEHGIEGGEFCRVRGWIDALRRPCAIVPRSSTRCAPCAIVLAYTTTLKPSRVFTNSLPLAETFHSRRNPCRRRCCDRKPISRKLAQLCPLPCAQRRCIRHRALADSQDARSYARSRRSGSRTFRTDGKARRGPAYQCTTSRDGECRGDRVSRSRPDGEGRIEHAGPAELVPAAFPRAGKDPARHLVRHGVTMPRGSDAGGRSVFVSGMRTARPNARCWSRQRGRSWGRPVCAAGA